MLHHVLVTYEPNIQRSTATNKSIDCSLYQLHSQKRKLSGSLTIDEPL